MQIEALWTVNFASHNGEFSDYGGGVVIFETNRIFGGDGSFYYLGEFISENGILKANVKIVQHRAGNSIFGSGEKFNMELSGKYKDGTPEFTMTGNDVK